MPTTRKLKVFRTTSGFHDAYVAVTSRKAALEAWGATTDLFAMGSAEPVTDPKLMAPALEKPGEVIKIKRGSAAEHLAAAGRQQPARSGRRGASPQRSVSRKTTPKPPAPRPSRKRLDQAEQALEVFEQDAEAALAALRERELALAKERAAVEVRLDKSRAQHRQRLEKARSAHEEALARWREQ